MGSSLTDLEANLRKSLELQARELSKLYHKLEGEEALSLEGKEISKAVVMRMKVYYDSKRTIADLLGKRQVPPASDFFVEAVLFYLRLYLKRADPQMEVHSERNIERRRGTLRPDISLWKEGRVVAAIECKTQLGWRRDTWESEFKEREAKFLVAAPRAKMLLLVMTSVNWGGFPANDRNVGKRYFALSRDWPTQATDENLESLIDNSLEDLFSELVRENKQSRRK